MKANRKALHASDEGVSPVIAVILMVAITVVLAATVYVWVSGFGASGSQAKSLSVSQGSATGLGALAGSVPFTVVSAASNFACSNLKVTDSNGAHGGPWPSNSGATPWMYYNMTQNGGNCAAGNLNAGDVLLLSWKAYTGSAVPNTGDSVNFVDKASGNVVATLALH